MSEPEKPLHVRVAEALGETVLFDKDDIGEMDYWYTEREDRKGRPRHEAVPRYDTSWDATGPLMEKYGISLTEPGEHGGAETNWLASKRVGWVAIGSSPHAYPDVIEAEGGTILLAVCNLLLALKEAGKL